MTKDDPQTDLLVDIQLICKDYGSASNPHLAVTLCRYIEHREQAKIKRLREALESLREYQSRVRLVCVGCDNTLAMVNAALGGEVNDGE